MSIKKLSFMLMVVTSLAAFMYGCGTSSKDSAISGSSVALVGDTSCIQCHSATADPLTGETFVTQYQRSLHAEIGCESCHGGGAQHNGIGPFPVTLNSGISDAAKAARCAQCHDGVTTYQGKIAPLSSSPNFSNGNHGNPFSAEEAHEAKCARCHSHEGAILYGKDGFTGDRVVLDNTAYQPVLARDPETFNTIKCATCHEHGANLRQTKTRDAAGNIVTWDPNKNKVTDQYDVCTSCHTMEVTNPNDATKSRIIGSGNILQVYSSSSVQSGVTGFKNVSTAAYYHNTSWYRTLPSTHYDQPESRTTASGTVIEGYVVRKNTKNPCFDCHGHEFKTNTRRVDPSASATVKTRENTTYIDWAESAHAGKLLKQKVAAAAANIPNPALTGAARDTARRAQVDAVIKAGVTDAIGPGWTHYNWDQTTGTGNRASCQRCHTSTGASNFMKNPAGYNSANNSFSHLAGWTAAAGSNQNELLYCWGCHSNAGTGKLYEPGARTETYSAVVASATSTTGTVATVAYPDIKGSNVCMTCHVGREVGQNIKNITDSDGVLGFVNSHYLAAGATLFGQSGYTYTGMSYTAPTFFAHDKIGTAAAPGTGTNGPCVSCHMTSPKKHIFTNVSTSTAGVIGKITSTSCVSCHTGGFALTAASLEAEHEEYKAALEGLKGALAAKGIFFGESHPYFFTAPYNPAYVEVGNCTTNLPVFNWNYGGTYTYVWDATAKNCTTAGSIGTPGTASTFKDVMGAAFNLNLLLHDPGGYAHNRFYAKRLIWDSIDYIDDGLLNNSVPAELALRLAGQTLTDAQTYLGATRP